MEELLSVTEAAAALNVTRSAVQQAIQAHRLPAIRIGSRYVLRRSDLADYKKAPGGPGRPRPSRQSPGVSEEKRAKRRKQLQEKRGNST
jgi:excisionase family DNA binding protein